jgi:hypothetical protein
MLEKTFQLQPYFVFLKANFSAESVLVTTVCSPKPDHLSPRKRKSILIFQREAASGIATYI